MGIERIIEPACEPITLEDVKANARITGTDDDAHISEILIPAARAFVETYLQRALVAQTWEWSRWEFPECNAPIVLPNPPLNHVKSITYVDDLGTTQTMAEGVDYTVDARKQPGRVYPYYETNWPSTRIIPNSVSVQYQAGYLVPVTVNDTSDILTIMNNNRTYQNGDAVVVNALGLSGVVPAGLTANSIYYIVNATSNTVQLSLTLGGSPIALTDDGTGQIYFGSMPPAIRQALLLLVSHSYEYREPIQPGTSMAAIPFSVEALLAPYRVQEFV